MEKNIKSEHLGSWHQIRSKKIKSALISKEVKLKFFMVIELGESIWAQFPIAFLLGLIKIEWFFYKKQELSMPLLALIKNLVITF